MFRFDKHVNWFLYSISTLRHGIFGVAAIALAALAAFDNAPVKFCLALELNSVTGFEITMLAANTEESLTSPKNSANRQSHLWPRAVLRTACPECVPPSNALKALRWHIVPTTAFATHQTFHCVISKLATEDQMALPSNPIKT